MWMVVYIMFKFLKVQNLMHQIFTLYKQKANMLKKENTNVPKCYQILRMLKTIKRSKQVVPLRFYLSFLWFEQHQPNCSLSHQQIAMLGNVKLSCRDSHHRLCQEGCVTQPSPE